jgi:hypothetical protein
VAAAALGGCYTTGEVGYRATYSSGPAASSDVYVSSPDLVTVSPGVQVVADYDEPVFYNEGFYWRFYGGGWYRSNNYATGWYFVDRPPVAVLRIDRPYAYAHYRPSGYVARNRARYRAPEPIVRDHRGPAYRAEPTVRTRGEVRTAPEPVVRDHRDYRAAPAPAPAPVVRDHRDPRAAPAPVTRAPAPASAPAPRAAPAEKKSDRTTRDHRDRDH